VRRFAHGAAVVVVGDVVRGHGWLIGAAPPTLPAAR
jgi:hypothetical protein